jgi:hypothetical protein
MTENQLTQANSLYLEIKETKERILSVKEDLDFINYGNTKVDFKRDFLKEYGSLQKKKTIYFVLQKEDLLKLKNLELIKFEDKLRNLQTEFNNL